MLKLGGTNADVTYPEDSDFWLMSGIYWYESDNMKKLYSTNFILDNNSTESVYNIDNGKYIYNNGQPVAGSSDWSIPQACAIFPFVTRSYSTDT
jgi:hypothetical protein